MAKAKPKKFRKDGRTKKLEKSSEASTNTAVSVYKRENNPPPPFRSAINFPRGRFLTIADGGFHEVLQHSYEGFVVAEHNTFTPEQHKEFGDALRDFETLGLYQFDVTQPLGLGTKCAQTLTLVGVPGITYKYLGLRMFAHPWEGPDAAAPSLVMARLNSILNRQSEQHLKKLGRQNVGSSSFNLALINRCFPREERSLKPEPMFGREPCSVSWHADSSLEHFSTIGVYHCLEDAAAAPPGTATDWRIALRVSPHAEGPGHSKLKPAVAPTAGGVPASMQGNGAPPVSVALPSGSAYFMLDDFNHHHQHAVLAGSRSRFASTHRVSRLEGHTVTGMLQRADAALAAPLARALSVRGARAEALALSELEFEWLRQFFVQGDAHRRAHVWWADPIARLLQCWVQLEARAAAAVQALEDAAAGGPPELPPAQLQPSGCEPGEEDAGAGDDGAGAGSEERSARRRARKRHAARVARAAAVLALGGRGAGPRAMSGGGSAGGCGSEGGLALFDALLELMGERAEKRALWAAREADPVFLALPPDARPLPVPMFGPAAPSPLPADLRPVIDRLRRARRAFVEGDDSYRPPPPLVGGDSLPSPAQPRAAPQSQPSLQPVRTKNAAVSGSLSARGSFEPALAVSSPAVWDQGASHRGAKQQHSRKLQRRKKKRFLDSTAGGSQSHQ